MLRVKCLVFELRVSSLRRTESGVSITHPLGNWGVAGHQFTCDGSTSFGGPSPIF